MPKYGSALRAVAEEAVRKVYEHGAGKNKQAYENEREEQARRFRKKYGSEGIGRQGEAQGNIQPYFIGVFDTVAALGISRCRRALFCFFPSATFTIVLTYFFCFDYWPIWGRVLLSSLVMAAVYVSMKRFRSIKNYPEKGDFS